MGWLPTQLGIPKLPQCENAIHLGLLINVDDQMRHTHSIHTRLKSSTINKKKLPFNVKVINPKFWIGIDKYTSYD